MAFTSLFILTCTDLLGHRAMRSLCEFLFGSRSLGSYCCYDSQLRPTDHGPEQRYVSPNTGRCRPLVIQAVHPRRSRTERIEVKVENTTNARKLAFWLVLNLPYKAEYVFPWFMLWIWFTFALIWPFGPTHTGFYPSYLSRFYGQLWVARSPREYSLRKAQLGEQPVNEVTHATYPRRLIIYHPESKSWKICSDKNIIKQQRYVAISYPYEDNILRGLGEGDLAREKEEFTKRVEAVVASLHETAYWMDLLLVDKTNSEEEINQDLYRMADVYRGAEFTLIMLSPPAGVTEEDAWLRYGERLWTFPEALLSRELRFQFRDEEVTPITLHQLANRAYACFAEELAIINAYALRDPLERLERLSLLKSALWRRTSGNLQRLEGNLEEPLFGADRVYALMGFFEHRIHPHCLETELQAFVRLSMANDNDRIVERMVSLLPSEIPDSACWNAEEDAWGANLWDIEPDIQVVGMTATNALVLGGCRAAAIRWKNFPSVAFATRRSIKRIIAHYLPYFSWELFLVGILVALFLQVSFTSALRWIPLIAAFVLMLFAPLSVAYGNSGRIVQAQPWLVGVKGLISAEKASTLMYGGAINSALPRTSYSASGTTLSRTHEGPFRCGDPAQLEELKAAGEADDLYTLVDTVSATIYYFRARRPPTVCLYTGRESGLGRFVLCSERCTINELHKETVVRMPWYVSQSMRACDWVALG